MAYAAWSVVAGEQPTAAKWNILGTNDASFNDGTGIASSAITTAKINAAAVTGAKLVNGMIYRRQGGSATVWSTEGTTTYDTSAVDPLVQVGSIADPAGQTNITFPVAYANTPIILYSQQSSSGAYPSHYSVLHSNTGFSIQLTGGTVGAVFAKWYAVGV